MGKFQHQGPPRPTAKELRKRLQAACDAMSEGRYALGTEKHLSLSYDFLGVSSNDELWDAVAELLEELSEMELSECYAGTKPPKKSYEPTIEGADLWAFCWHSQTTGCETYLKFAVVNDWLFFVDCHEGKES